MFNISLKYISNIHEIKEKNYFLRNTMFFLQINFIIIKKCVNSLKYLQIS